MSRSRSAPLAQAGPRRYDLIVLSAAGPWGAVRHRVIPLGTWQWAVRGRAAGVP
jgi:hypothetical protein